MTQRSTVSFAFVQAPEPDPVIALPWAPAAGLPPPPSPKLDPMLDAASVCMAARGVSRTTLSDIARELGVAPSTVYRNVGSVENAAWLLCAREAHRLFARLPEIVAPFDGARMVTAVMAAGIETARAHPVFAHILAHEPDFVGRAVTRRMDAIIDQVTAALAPVLGMAMDMGVVRRTDPDPLAHWLTRVALICVLTPPPGDLHAALDEILLPQLAPSP
jgi:AcrR family transcriptional regulator